MDDAGLDFANAGDERNHETQDILGLDKDENHYDNEL